MDFRDLFDKRLLALGLSYAEFARKVGVKSPFISRVRKGKSPVPKNRIEAWADVLDLSGKARAAFVEEALLTRCPLAIRIRFRQLKDEVAALRSK